MLSLPSERSYHLLGYWLGGFLESCWERGSYEERSNFKAMTTKYIYIIKNERLANATQSRAKFPRTCVPQTEKSSAGGET